MDADGRFAPSPTGSLHLGNLRTALLAWLFARSQDARFLVRVEDLDAGRVQAGCEEQQLADLRALGLDWDGPVVRQSERAALYAAALERLEAQGLLYECWCTRAEIREAASAPHGALPGGAYPGTCLRLGAAERAARRASGRPAALRVRAGGARIAFEDRLCGPVEGVVDDLVVRRNDGAFAYNLAVVVDDAEQGIGEVVRGADLLDSTPRQLLARRAARAARPAPCPRPADARPRRRAPGQAPRRRHAGRPGRPGRVARRRAGTARRLRGARRAGRAAEPGRARGPLRPRPPGRGGGAVSMRVVRTWLPLVIIATGLAIILATRTETGIEGGGMLVATGISVWLLNWFYRLGVRGDRDRDREDRARAYFDAHGRWPDDDEPLPARSEDDPEAPEGAAERPAPGHRTAPRAHGPASGPSRPSRRPPG